jgi:hypothetical protein
MYPLSTLGIERPLRKKYGNAEMSVDFAETPR